MCKKKKKLRWSTFLGSLENSVPNVSFRISSLFRARLVFIAHAVLANRVEREREDLTSSRRRRQR